MVLLLEQPKLTKTDGNLVCCGHFPEENREACILTTSTALRDKEFLLYHEDRFWLAYHHMNSLVTIWVNTFALSPTHTQNHLLTLLGIITV